MNSTTSSGPIPLTPNALYYVFAQIFFVWGGHLH